MGDTHERRHLAATHLAANNLAANNLAAAQEVIELT
jgi:hypothetical protein